MPKKKPSAEAIADLHGQLSKAGCSVVFHDMGQWNIRKGDRLAMWFPFSKKQCGCIDDLWQPGITLKDVLDWLGADTATPIATVGENSDRRFAILNKQIQNIMERLVNIEERLAPPA